MYSKIYSNCIIWLCQYTCIWQWIKTRGHRWIVYKPWIVGHCRTRGICKDSSLSIQYCKILDLLNNRLKFIKMMIISILRQLYLFNFRLIYLWLVLTLQIKIRCQISKNFGHLNLEVIVRYRSKNNQGNIPRSSK